MNSSALKVPGTMEPGTKATTNGGLLMFVIYEPGKTRIPIKVWLPSTDELDPGCLEQARNLANLGFAVSHIALMPDTHVGFGMPIGGVLATQDYVIPNAVGVDIGCGVHFVLTNLPADILRQPVAKNKSLGSLLVRKILDTIPTGFEHHRAKQASSTLKEYQDKMRVTGALPNLEEGYFQIGTLGGGNHFIELQEDDSGLLGVMVHSGSRNFGYKVAKHFNAVAKKQNTLVPKHYDLAPLAVNSPEGRGYLCWHNLSLDFAAENRERMVRQTLRLIGEAVLKHLRLSLEITKEVTAHHNYLTHERYHGKEVWVHRKGAIRAAAGEDGIIPGAMGSYSYITEGLGNEEAFCSSSHGAGRRLGRREAKRTYSPEMVRADLQERGIFFGKRRMADAGEEYVLAYKDIRQVMAYQEELTKPALRLKTVAVIKG